MSDLGSDSMYNFFKGRIIAITGAAGSLGKEAIARLLEMDVKEIRAIDNSEKELFSLKSFYNADSRLNVFLLDVRSYVSLANVLSEADYVIHAAAFKHVAMGERNPFETIQTNVIGVQNVIRASLKNNVRKVIFTSTDKAVNPTNVMGTTKLLGERLFTAANGSGISKASTIFASARFGNVAGSDGSVIPIFLKQIKNKGPVTLTHREMTRFVMTKLDAVLLLLRSLMLARGGEVFISKMHAVNIEELAVIMVKKLSPLFGHNPEDILIEQIGIFPGEKMFEELINGEEIRRTFELSDMFVILPALGRLYENTYSYYNNISDCKVDKQYNSFDEPKVGKDFIENMLQQPGVLPEYVKY